MIVTTAPTPPNPSNMATFDSLAYPFAKWCYNTAKNNSVSNSLNFGTPLVSSGWHTLQLDGRFIKTYGYGSLEANTTYYAPFTVPQVIDITEIGSGVNGGGGTVRYAIAGGDGSDPTYKIVSTTAVAASAGAVTVAIPTTRLYPNTLYWFGINRSVASTLCWVFSPSPGTMLPSTGLITSVDFARTVSETHATAFTNFSMSGAVTYAPILYSKGTLI